eukprot:comp14775_c0_seq1/m.11194 comp14775_c0_seq1/g.11194  ORF comp14775_c0_seq1/g.11194 comp14775_c0_seq1/m.11194 type:complete len:349 (-) comp14775_c0_seq1:506-1552(-)
MKGPRVRRHTVGNVEKSTDTVMENGQAEDHFARALALLKKDTESSPMDSSRPAPYPTKVKRTNSTPVESAPADAAGIGAPAPAVTTQGEEGTAATEEVKPEGAEKPLRERNLPASFFAPGARKLSKSLDTLSDIQQRPSLGPGGLPLFPVVEDDEYLMAQSNPAYQAMMARRGMYPAPAPQMMQHHYPHHAHAHHTYHYHAHHAHAHHMHMGMGGHGPMMYSLGRTASAPHMGMGHAAGPVRPMDTYMGHAGPYLGSVMPEYPVHDVGYRGYGSIGAVPAMGLRPVDSFGTGVDTITTVPGSFAMGVDTASSILDNDMHIRPDEIEALMRGDVGMPFTAATTVGYDAF